MMCKTHSSHQQLHLLCIRVKLLPTPYLLHVKHMWACHATPNMAWPIGQTPRITIPLAQCKQCGSGDIQQRPGRRSSDVVLKSNRNLNLHIASVHEGKRPYQCLICNGTFTQKAHLNTHVKSIHEEKKPHECSICDSKFKGRTSLKYHIETVHEEKKRYQCDACEKSYSTNFHLKHLR